MKLPLQNKLFALGLTSLCLSSMLACSSQQGVSSNAGGLNTSSNSNNNNTTNPVVPGGNGYNSSGQAITSCSHDVAGVSDLSISLQVYTSGSPAVPDLNQIRLKFNAFPGNFTNSNSAIAFWAYGTDSSGNWTTMYQVPFSLELNTGKGSFRSISGSLSTLTWAQLQSYASANGASTGSAAAALQSITFNVSLYSASSSTVLEPAIYTNGIGTASDRYIQGLIPSFLADPNAYISTHNNTLLNLHPLKAYQNSGNSQAQFLSLGNNLCF